MLHLVRKIIARRTHLIRTKPFLIAYLFLPSKKFRATQHP